eukprot:SAG11_NODE_36612_length_260_cov_2.366460_1_plen_39_part_10
MEPHAEQFNGKQKLQLPCAQPLTPTRLLEQGLPFLALEA